MSIKQLEQTLQLAWNRQPAAEKLIAKVLAGLAAIAAGNSGVQ